MPAGTIQEAIVTIRTKQGLVPLAQVTVADGCGAGAVHAAEFKAAHFGLSMQSVRTTAPAARSQARL